MNPALSPEVVAAYESLSTDQLVEMRWSFRADRAAASRPESIEFIVGRLALIARVLRKRDEAQQMRKREAEA